MSEHRASVYWRRDTETFDYETYSRNHIVRFDGGIEVPASAAPDFKGDAKRLDPEKALVGALSSCHMLTFLAVASKKRMVVDEYNDNAVGHLEKNSEGKLAVTRVELFPVVKFAPGTTVTAETLGELHHKAHENCFIANSVKTAVKINPA